MSDFQQLLATHALCVRHLQVKTKDAFICGNVINSLFNVFCSVNISVNVFKNVHCQKHGGIATITRPAINNNKLKLFVGKF